MSTEPLIFYFNSVSASRITIDPGNGKRKVRKDNPFLGQENRVSTTIGRDIAQGKGKPKSPSHNPMAQNSSPVESQKHRAMENRAFEAPQASHKNDRAHFILKETSTQISERKILDKSTVVTSNRVNTLYSEGVDNFPPQPSEMTLKGQITDYRNLTAPVIMTSPSATSTHPLPPLTLPLYLAGLLKKTCKKKPLNLHPPFHSNLSDSLRSHRKSSNTSDNTCIAATTSRPCSSFMVENRDAGDATCSHWGNRWETSQDSGAESRVL